MILTMMIMVIPAAAAEDRPVGQFEFGSREAMLSLYSRDWLI